MRRFCRGIINLFAVLSLIVCLLTAALWARSFWTNDQFEANQGGGHIWILSNSGHIAVGWIDGAAEAELVGWQAESAFFCLGVICLRRGPRLRSASLSRTVSDLRVRPTCHA